MAKSTGNNNIGDLDGTSDKLSKSFSPYVVAFQMQAHYPEVFLILVMMH